jgi:hypothetical protein
VRAFLIEGYLPGYSLRNWRLGRAGLGTEGTVIAGRVIMLSRDQGLASIVGEFVGRGQPLARFSSPAEVPDWLRPPTGAVVLDFPKPARVIVYRQLRRRYLGPVLALLDPDEDSSGLPTDHGGIGTLHRPFTGAELTASLDALAGTRNGARRPNSPSLTAPPLGEDAAPLEVSAIFAATPASLRARHVAVVSGPTTPPPLAIAGKGAAVAGVPATRLGRRGVEAARRRRLVWRPMGPTARRRVNGLALTLGVVTALVLGVMLSAGGGCRSIGCGNVATAIENGEVGIRPVGPDPAASQPGALAGGSGNGAAKSLGTAAATDPPPGPRMVIPIASGIGDLISGTSSSSGGAPLLVVATGPASGGSGGGTGSGSGGGTGAGVPPATTLPSATTSPPTTAPPTTGPPTTSPPTTEPPTTAPPTTEPPTTEPPTTEPPTTAPPTTSPPTTEPPTTAPPTTEPPTTGATSAPTTETTLASGPTAAF